MILSSFPLADNIPARTRYRRVRWNILPDLVTKAAQEIMDEVIIFVRSAHPTTVPQP